MRDDGDFPTIYKFDREFDLGGNFSLFVFCFFQFCKLLELLFIGLFVRYYYYFFFVDGVKITDEMMWLQDTREWIWSGNPMVDESFEDLEVTECDMSQI